jgi:hypothetical protein
MRMDGPGQRAIEMGRFVRSRRRPGRWKRSLRKEEVVTRGGVSEGRRVGSLSGDGLSR